MNANSASQWSIGQKVICIDDSFPSNAQEWCTSFPVAGYVYTIRAMQAGRDPATGSINLGFLLVEIRNDVSSLGHEAGFWHDRFVPWVDVSTESNRNDATEPLQVQSTI